MGMHTPYRSGYHRWTAEVGSLMRALHQSHAGPPDDVRESLCRSVSTWSRRAWVPSLQTSPGKNCCWRPPTQGPVTRCTPSSERVSSAQSSIIPGLNTHLRPVTRQQHISLGIADAPCVLLTPAEPGPALCMHGCDRPTQKERRIVIASNDQEHESRAPEANRKGS